MKNCKKRKRRFPVPSDLVLFLTVLVFGIILLSNVITMFVAVFAVKHEWIMPNQDHHPSISYYLFFLMILSMFIAILLSLFFSHIPLKPMQTVIDAMDAFSKGDFSVRLKERGLKPYVVFIRNFNLMAEALGHNEMLKQDFINNFSHEFKTPIVSIRGFAKILRTTELSEEEKNEYLDIIISESTRLSALANNVLNLGKIESQTVLTSTSNFLLSEQIRKCILLLEKRWEEKNLDMDIYLDEIMFTGNEELLMQVWLNLLDNAIKYSEENNSIRIQLRQSHEKIIFAITNNGTGILPAEQSKIFDKFYQCDTSHASHGNGLGLSVVKKVVELHDGKIIVSSIPGTETTFTVFLPLNTDQES